MISRDAQANRCEKCKAVLGQSAACFACDRLVTTYRVWQPNWLQRSKLGVTR